MSGASQNPSIRITSTLAASVSSVAGSSTCRRSAEICVPRSATPKRRTLRPAESIPAVNVALGGANAAIAMPMNSAHRIGVPYQVAMSIATRPSAAHRSSPGTARATPVTAADR